MIKKLPKKEDPFKKEIEKISQKIQNKEVPKISESEQKEYYKQIQENLPKLASEINELINILIKDIKSCNARQILDYFGTLYSFSSPNTVVNDMDSERNFYLDYIHSLVSAVGDLNQKDCNEKTLNRIAENIEKLKMQSIFYLMLTSDYKGLPNEVKFQQVIHNMIVRGDSYTKHKIQMCKELFSKFDEVLQSKYHITANDLIDELTNISNYSIKNLEIQKKYFDVLKISHQEFVKKLDEISDDAAKFEFIKKYKESENAKNVQKKLDEIYYKTGVSLNDSIFKINKTLLPNEILEQLSMEIGENTDFKNGKIEYFPTNNTHIYNKPLIKIDDEYYCFNPALIIYNLHTILENIVLNVIPPKKHQKNYYKKKGEYLEDKSLELFQDLLPNCEIYKNLKYGVDDEVDGIVIYDNNIFIVEAKSGKFSTGAKKGNIEKIKNDTKKLIEEAYQQAIRAKKYIIENSVSEFRDKKRGKPILNIKKHEINNIYLVNVTLEPLNHLTTNLSSLKEFEYIEEDEWIWSVYLNDLRIISEIIDSPSEFLLYIDRRIKFNDYPQVKIAEEIDIFGYFLNEGLYFEDINFPENGFMLTIDSSYSKDIDLYYLWKEGVLDKVQKKPSLFYKCKDNIKFLVQKIESLNKKNFSVLTTFLLNYDCHTQSYIKNEIENIFKLKRTDFHFFNEEKNLGVVFVSKRIYDYNKVSEQCELYAYERKINNWFVIIIGKDFIDFEKFYYDNKPNKIIEEKLKGLKKYRLNQTLSIKKKIGRNEPCPCGSGKKYKKCCGR